jgi:competence protein ComEC
VEPLTTVQSADSTPTVRAARVRALAALAALILGLILARKLADHAIPATLWFSLAAGASALAALTSQQRCKFALLATVLLISAGVYTARLTEHHRDSLAHLLDPDTPTILTIDATIIDEPRLTQSKSNFISRTPSLVFNARVDHRRNPDRRARGTLRVHAPASLKDTLHVGDRIRITGNAKGLAPPLNPGEADRRPFQYQRNIVGSISVPNPALIEPLKPASWQSAALATLIRARTAIQSRARDLLLDPISTDEQSPSRSLLAALVLGQRDINNTDQRAAFTRIGIAHLMAISGFHVAMMVLVAMLLVRFAGDLGRLEPAILAALVLLYLLSVPASPPVLRASTMVLVVLASETLGRRYDRLTLLLWTAFVMLLVRPADLWSMGFQLSFTLVAALMTLAKPAHDALWGLKVRTDIPTPSRWSHIPIESIKLTTTMTIVCWLIAMPIVIYHTGLVSPLAILTTAITLPLIMVILILAYAALIVGVLVPPAAYVVGSVLEHLANATLWVVNHLDAIPGSSLSLPRVSLAWTLAASLLAAAWLVRGRLRDAPLWIAAAFIALWLTLQVWSHTRLPPAIALRLDAIAVGDGTSILVRAGNDALLWDCGSETPSAGARMIPRAIRALDGHHVNTVVITHPNTDHYNALADAIKPLAIKRVIVGQRFIDAADMQFSASVRELLAQLETQGVALQIVRQGDTITLGGSTLTFLSPPPDAPWSEHNNHSLVARINTPVTGGTVTTLLTGDIERQAITQLLDDHPNLHPRILELPHHGSVNDAAARLITTLDPDIVIQSTGPSRAYDPRWNFARQGRRWLTTATQGCATITIHPDGSISTATTRPSRTPR